MADTIIGKQTTEISILSYKNLCKENGIHLFEVGRKGIAKNVKESTKTEVTQLSNQYHIGVRKMHRLMLQKGIQVSRRQIDSIYSEIAPERKR